MCVQKVWYHSCLKINFEILPPRFHRIKLRLPKLYKIFLSSPFSMAYSSSSCRCLHTSWKLSYNLWMRCWNITLECQPGSISPFGLLEGLAGKQARLTFRRQRRSLFKKVLINIIRRKIVFFVLNVCKLRRWHDIKAWDYFQSSKVSSVLCGTYLQRNAVVDMAHTVFFWPIPEENEWPPMIQIFWARLQFFVVQWFLQCRGPLKSFNENIFGGHCKNIGEIRGAQK